MGFHGIIVSLETIKMKGDEISWYMYWFISVPSWNITLHREMNEEFWNKGT